MSKFYIIKDLISLSNYGKKYKVNLRKIYRYVHDQIVEHYIIDNMYYLPDKEISLLINNHGRFFLHNNVKPLTPKVLNVKGLTLRTENIDNEEVNNVKVLTSEQKRILETSDVKLNAENLDKKYKILNLIEKIKRI